MSLTPYTSDFAEKTANCTGEYKKKKRKKSRFHKEDNVTNIQDRTKVLDGMQQRITGN